MIFQLYSIRYNIKFLCMEENEYIQVCLKIKIFLTSTLNRVNHNSKAKVDSQNSNRFAKRFASLRA